MQGEVSLRVNRVSQSGFYALIYNWQRGGH